MISNLKATYHGKLNLAAHYLLFFEYANSKVIDTVRNFFADTKSVSLKGSRVRSNETEEYINEVIILKARKNEHRLITSFRWLLKLGFIVDLNEVLNLIDHRNYIAHDLCSFLEDNTVTKKPLLYKKCLLKSHLALKDGGLLMLRQEHF